MVESKNKTLMPLLVVDFQFQNPSIVGPIEPHMVDDDEFVFGVMTSNEAILYGLLKNGLFLFRHLHVKPKDCLLPPT
jgi:hypothetical protein